MACFSCSIPSTTLFFLVIWFISVITTANAFLASPFQSLPPISTGRSGDIFGANAHVSAQGWKKVAVRMTASGDEELEGLRRENESLKEELKALSKRSKLPADKISFNPLKALGKLFLPELKSAADYGDGHDSDVRQGETEIVSSTSSSKRAKRDRGSLNRGGTDTGLALDEIFKDAPFPINLVGGLVKGVASVMEETFQDSEDDVELVIQATERALQHDQQASMMLGEGSAKCLSPVGKSYAKSTINGLSSVSVGLQMPVRGSESQGSVSVKASVGENTGTGRSNKSNSKVTLKAVNLTVNGRTISVKPAAAGKGMENAPRRAPGANTDGGKNVVDVEYTER